MAKSAAERKALERERRAASGLQRFELWLRPNEWPAVQRLVERLRRNKEKK
jgi:hypothetical protein